MPDELELAQHVVDLARRAGADEAEATYTVANRFSTEARDREIVKLERSVARGLSLRVFVRGAKASLGTSDLSAQGLADFARETVDAARFVASDAHGGLPTDIAAVPEDPTLEMYAEDVRARPAEAKIDDALQLERIARAVDTRIVNSAGSRLADTTLALALANSHGFAGSYRQSQVSAGSSPIASDAGNLRTASYGAASRAYATLEPIASVARIAANRAVEMIGARKPQTMRCPVIFERDVAAHVLADIFAAVNAANVAVGNSFLAERVGERIGSAYATIVDDGRLPRGLGTSPFDAEGVPTRRTVVMDGGTLRTFLYDTYYARKLGAHSTGNASGGGIGPNNFYLAPGPHALADLVGATQRGILVLDTIGFSTESVTGTYSRGARGFAIENGELAYPIDEFTIAGNLLEMLAAIDLVGSDLVFDQPIVAPSFRVSEMTVSGT